MNTCMLNEKEKLVYDIADKLHRKKDFIDMKQLCNISKCNTCPYKKFGTRCYEVMEVLEVCDFGFDSNEILDNKS